MERSDNLKFVVVEICVSNDEMSGLGHIERNRSKKDERKEVDRQVAFCNEAPAAVIPGAGSQVGPFRDTSPYSLTPLLQIQIRGPK